MNSDMLPWDDNVDGRDVDEKNPFLLSIPSDPHDYLDVRTLQAVYHGDKKDDDSVIRVSNNKLHGSLARQLPTTQLEPNVTISFVKHEINEVFKERHQKFLNVLETKNSWGKNQIKEAFTTIMAGMDYNG